MKPQNTSLTLREYFSIYGLNKTLSELKPLSFSQFRNYQNIQNYDRLLLQLKRQLNESINDRNKYDEISQKINCLQGMISKKSKREHKIESVQFVKTVTGAHQNQPSALKKMKKPTKKATQKVSQSERNEKIQKYISEENQTREKYFKLDIEKNSDISTDILTTAKSQLQKHHCQPYFPLGKISMPKNSEKIYTPKIGSMFSEKQESKKSASEPENKSNFFKNRKRKYSGEQKN